MSRTMPVTSTDSLALSWTGWRDFSNQDDLLLKNATRSAAR
jgi:hypothetical protein